METIQERAKEYSLKEFDGYYTGREKAVEEGYIAGAKEQKEIDKMEGEALLYVANKVAERTKKEMIDKACKWLKYRSEYPFTDAIIESFRKYMEDEDNYGHN